MRIKLNTEGTISVIPQSTPENLNSIYISYVFPKGLNFLTPVLTWGDQTYSGDRIYIKKAPINFNMKVVLYKDNEVYKVYRTTETPELYIGYNIDQIAPDIVQRLRALEEENLMLKERGDII